MPIFGVDYADLKRDRSALDALARLDIPFPVVPGALNHPITNFGEHEILARMRAETLKPQTVALNHLATGLLSHHLQRLNRMIPVAQKPHQLEVDTSGSRCRLTRIERSASSHPSLPLTICIKVRGERMKVYSGSNGSSLSITNSLATSPRRTPHIFPPLATRISFLKSPRRCVFLRWSLPK